MSTAARVRLPTCVAEVLQCRTTRFSSTLTHQSPECTISASHFRQYHNPTDTLPFRKQLKDEQKRQRDIARKAQPIRLRKGKSDEKWELTIGIEIHAQLNTRRKLFSGANTSTTDEPNTHVSVFDAALPGAQPTLQKEVLVPAIRAGHALNCTIQKKSAFDRKHYFYQDQPAGYQITQYYYPFARDGHIMLFDHDGIAPEDGKEIKIGIKQIQLEQDTGKTLLQPPDIHLLDFNRVSHPLIEIITLPDIHHSATAAACVRKIQALLSAIDACVIGMEMGGLRADVNVSVKAKDPLRRDSTNHEYAGRTDLGQRTEVKNLSSFNSIQDAIEAERRRQVQILEAGGTVKGETRGWTLGSQETKLLRGKEGEVDYRYMPDPDLRPLYLSESLIKGLSDQLPWLPDAWLTLLVQDPTYSLSLEDARILVALDEGARLIYYLDVVSKLQASGINTSLNASSKKVGRVAGNWVLHELGGLLSTSGKSWDENLVTATALSSILYHLLSQKITGRTAKHILAAVFSGDTRDVADIIEEQGLWFLPLTAEEYEGLAVGVIEANENVVHQIQQKKQTGKIKFLVGLMMRADEDGRVEAGKAEAAIRDALDIHSKGASP